MKLPADTIIPIEKARDYSLSRGEEVIAIARNEERLPLGCVPQHLLIRRGDRKHLAQLDDSVAQGLQGEGNVVRHIVVQQEFHCVAAAICRATSTSISPR